MGRLHRHADGANHDHDHDHDHADAGAGADAHSDTSGYRTGPELVLVLERTSNENDRCAALNRTTLDDAGVVAVNMKSSPGAGKTEILRRTLATLSDPKRIGII